MSDQFETNNRRSGRKYFFFIPFFVMAALLFVGWIVMVLWNNILPSVTSFRELTYWQAVGLLMLCRILFGGFRGPSNRGWQKRGSGNAWNRKWMQMSDEEKASFREEWRKRCGKPD